MMEMARQRRWLPAAFTMTPANNPTVMTDPPPWVATIGASTTTMAPVKPETCKFDPPKTAAMHPPKTAVMSPA